MTLAQRDHAHQRRCMWQLACSRRPAHARELLLEALIEQLVPVQLEKAEQ
ncbi:hypothetical protein [Sorangium sp. So ce260]